jgi:hypothetical protein
MQERPSRKYQRSPIRGKGLSIWLYPALRARIEAAAQRDNTSLSAIIVAVLTEKFLGSTEEQKEAAK